MEILLIPFKNGKFNQLMFGCSKFVTYYIGIRKIYRFHISRYIQGGTAISTAEKAEISMLF